MNEETAYPIGLPVSYGPPDERRFWQKVRRVVARKLVVVLGDGLLAADGREIYSARGLRVGLFD